MSVSLFGCEERADQGQSNAKDTTEAVTPSVNEEKIVVGVVEKFGSKLQNVSLLSPIEELEKSMQENYGDLVSPELIEKWLTDPLEAPGRLTSSPWPDRIDITATEKLSENAYAVDGKIIEVANVNEIVNEIQIRLVVEKVGEHWLINEVTLGDSE